jgi:predicted NUDIX family NTP pyrophosphohydrolase
MDVRTKQYQIKMKGDPEEKLKQAKKIAAEQGVTFVGDGTKGKFSDRIMGGRLIGTYTVNDGVLMVTITEKPFLTSWNMIEGQLKEFLKS